jgi:hypothetical protein
MPTTQEQKQEQEAKIYTMFAGALLVVMLSFGVLTLTGVIR